MDKSKGHITAMKLHPRIGRLDRICRKKPFISIETVVDRP
jgi:hypothetical protein